MCSRYSASVWLMNGHFSQPNYKATSCFMRKHQAVWIFHSSFISSKLSLSEEAILSWFQNLPEVLYFLSRDLWVFMDQPRCEKERGRQGKIGVKSKHPYSPRLNSDLANDMFHGHSNSLHLQKPTYSTSTWGQEYLSCSCVSKRHMMSVVP